MKIQGVDPVFIERIRDKNRKTLIYEADQTKKTGEKENRKRDQDKKRKSKKYLDISLEKLNRLLEEVDAPVRFLEYLDERDGTVFVQVVDVYTNKVLSVMFPEKVFQLVKNLDDPKGLIVDDSI